MDLKSHVDITLTVLESFKDVLDKYFKVDDLVKLVEDIHLAADTIVRDFNHHGGGKNFRERIFYHIMKARSIWLGILDGRLDPKDPEIVREFFENLVLAMHLFQDAVIFPKDMREHDFIEKKIGDLLKRNKVLVYPNSFSLLDCRAKLKNVGFNTEIAYYIDPEKACIDAANWSIIVAKAVMSGRVISGEEAERFLVKNGVVRVTGVRDNRLGQPIRDSVANRRNDISSTYSWGIKLALIHLLAVGYGFVSYIHSYYNKGYYNLYVEIWLSLFPIWIGLPIALFVLKKIKLRRHDKRARKEFERAELLDYYPSHAFFDAPDVYLEYMGDLPMKRRSSEKKVSPPITIK